MLDADGETHALIVQPKSRVWKPVTLTVSAVGDDSEASSVSLVGALASAKSARAIPVQNGGRFGPITLPANGPVRFEVTLESPRKLALRVTAHEG